MSVFINQIQLDFNLAIVFDRENQIVSYQTLMTVQNNNFADIKFLLNPCVPSPCKNGGNCISGYNNNYLCVCSSSYTGILKTNLKLKKIKTLFF